MQNRTKVYSVIFVISMLMISIVVGQQYKVHEIQSAYDIGYQNQYLYGIDVTQEYFYLYRANMETEQQNYIPYPIQKKGQQVILQYPAMDKNNHLYIYHYEQGTQTIDFCNFEKRTLQPLWNVNDILAHASKTGTAYFAFLLTREDGALIGIVADQNRMIQYELLPDGNFRSIQELYLQQNIDWLEVDASLQFWAYGLDGSVYRITENGVLQSVFLNDGTQVSRRNIEKTIENNEVHFYNIDTGKNYKVSADDETLHVEICTNHDNKTALHFDVSKVYNDYETEEQGIYTGILPLSDGRQVQVLYGTKEYILDTLYLPSGQVFLWTMGLFSTMSICGLLYIWIFHFLWYKKGGAPIWGIATMVLFPLLLGSLVIFSHFVNHDFLEHRNEQRMEQLSEISASILKQIPMQTFATYQQKEFVTAEDIAYLYTAPYEYGVYVVNDALSATNIFHKLYFYQNDEIYSANREEPWNVPAYDFLNIEVYTAIQKTAQQQQTVSLIYANVSGRYLCLYSPILNIEDTVIGVLEVSQPLLYVLAEDSQHVDTVIQFLFLFSFLLFGCIQIILWKNTRSLHTLRTTIIEFSDGEYSKRANLKGKNEIDTAGKKLDNMADRIELQMEEVSQYRQKYESFLVMNLFSVLSRKGICDVTLGMNTDCVLFTLYMSKQHCCFAEQIELIYAHEGAVWRMLDNHTSCVFLNKNCILDCAIALIQQHANCCIGIATEQTTVSIVGTQTRKSVSLVPKSRICASQLQQLAVYFGASIVVCGDYDQQIQKYHCRILGMVKSDNGEQIVYEILDGITQQSFLKKWETKTEFETGIHLYWSGQKQSARKCFIHVLEQNPDDIGARNYVYLCEQPQSSIYLEMESGGIV